MAEYGDQSELAQAKYLARFYTLNAWLGCGAVWWSLYNANHIQEWAIVRSADMSPRPAYYSASYLAVVLDEAEGTKDIPAEIVGDAPPDLMVKVFRNPKGETLVGLWRKSPPDDNCASTPVTIRVGAAAAKAEILDVLYGKSQRAKVRPVGDGTEMPGILVGDWPVFVRFR